MPSTVTFFNAGWPSKSRSARIRSKVQRAEEGEASTSYFFRLEKRNGERRLFSAFRSMCGVIVSSLVDISRAWVSFYGSLFTAQSLDISQQDFFLDQISRKLTDPMLSVSYATANSPSKNVKPL